MLGAVLWLVLGLVVLVLLAVWVTWTAMRIDRLDARVAGAWQSLDAQLVRRAMALQAACTHHDETRMAELTERALVAADRPSRAEAENAVGAAVAALPADAVDERLRTACIQVQTARTFYNDAVRAYAALRAQRLPRLLRLGAATEVPPYFDIDDSPGTR